VHRPYSLEFISLTYQLLAHRKRTIMTHREPKLQIDGNEVYDFQFKGNEGIFSKGVILVCYVKIKI
jgi:hypothetical protein